MSFHPLAPYLDEEHLALAGRLSSHGADWLAPIHDRRRSIEDRSREIVGTLAEEGLLHLAVPALYGGSHPEADVRGVCLAREALARVHLTADFVFGTQANGTYLVAQSAREPFKSEVLSGIVDGKTLAAFAAVEPEAGSDLAAISCAARRTSQAYFLSGVKNWVSMAGLADAYVVFARTDEHPVKGLSAFFVAADSEGLRVESGPALTAPLPIGVLHLDQVRVPRAHRLGDEGAGFELARQTLDHFRPAAGASALGLAARAIDLSTTHLEERRQFGRRLADFQALRFTLAEMSAELAAARCLVYHAAWTIDRANASGTPFEDGGPVATLASQAKLIAVDTAGRIVDRAADLFGASGLVAGSPIERLTREVRLLRAYLGTAEIQKMLIGRALLGPVERDRT